MRKIGILIILITVLGACKQEQNPENIQKQIFEYKEKISELQKQLDTINDNSDSDNSVLVKVQEAKPSKMIHYIKSTAYINAVEQAYVSPEMNGQIKRIYVKEGQFVKKGQTLVSLNANVIRSSIEEVKTGLELANVMYEKQKKLWDQKVGKELDYLQAKNQKESLEAKLKTLNAQLAMTVIKAPISGIIDEIYLKEGEMAAPGRQIINLINLSKMEADADVSEKYLPVVHKGDSVTLSFPAYPDIIINTKITRTGNEINPVNRTFKVTVEFKNIKNKIKPNMIGEISFADYSGINISVPSLIVKKDTKGEYLFIVKEENGKYFAKKTYVKTSYMIRDKIIIEQGLNEGDKVITEGFNLVSNNQEVKIN